MVIETHLPGFRRNSNMINKVPTVSDITQVWQFLQIVFRSILVELLQNPAFQFSEKNSFTKFQSFLICFGKQNYVQFILYPGLMVYVEFSRKYFD